MKISPLFFAAVSAPVTLTYAQLATSTASHLGDEERRIQENSMSIAESLMKSNGTPDGMDRGSGFGGKSGKDGKCAIEAMNNAAFVSDVDRYQSRIRGVGNRKAGYRNTFRSTFSFFTPPDLSGENGKMGAMQVAVCAPGFRGQWLATQTGFPTNGILQFLMVRSDHNAKPKNVMGTDLEVEVQKKDPREGFNDIMMGQYNCNTNEIWLGAGEGESRGAGFGMSAPALGYDIGDLKDHYPDKWDERCFDKLGTLDLPLYGSKSSKGGRRKY